VQPGRFEITLKVFLVDGDRILVLRDRESREGDLPGGRLGADEMAQPWMDAVARELREELGPHARWRVDPEPLFVWPHQFASTGLDGLGIAFAGTWEGGRLTLSDEHEAFAWVPVEGTDMGDWFQGTMLQAARRFQQRPRSG
jgi:8-oxo-dGTP pyrophosphatase MutT (NUDIX family)